MVGGAKRSWKKTEGSAERGWEGDEESRRTYGDNSSKRMHQSYGPFAPLTSRGTPLPRNRVMFVSAVSLACSSSRRRSHKLAPSLPREKPADCRRGTSPPSASSCNVHFTNINLRSHAQGSTPPPETNRIRIRVDLT